MDKICYVKFECPDVFTMDDVKLVAENYFKDKFPEVVRWSIQLPEYKYTLANAIVFKVVGSIKSQKSAQ